MKKNTVKNILAVLIAVTVLITLNINTFAETISDKLEKRLNDLVNEYVNADPDEQQSIEERFNAFLSKYGLDEMDLSSITETDIGQIIADIGGGSFDDIKKLASDAFSSGLSMIQDALGGGLGTSNGSNTVKDPVTSPNVIIAQTSPSNQNSNAVGVPANNIPPVTQEAATYDVGNQVSDNNMVGAVVTQPEPVSVSLEDSGMGTASVVVLVVLAVATLAVLVAIVIFFVNKRK